MKSERKFEGVPKPFATGALLIAPGAALFLVWLPAVSLTHGMLQKGFDPVSALVVTPFWAGTIAAPGYMKAALSCKERQPFWVRSSVVLALLTSIGGAVAAIPLLFPVPFALGSAISAFVLLRRLRSGSSFGGRGESQIVPMERSPAGERDEK